MNKIRIITDSASDFVKPIRDYMTILPLTVRFGDKEYRDGVDISHSEFYEKLIESDELPTTSLISPAEFEEEYKKATLLEETVIVVTISSKLSGTYQSALVAAEGYNNVFVVDSMCATIGEQIVIEYLIELLESGIGAKAAVDIIEKEKHNVHMIALLDTLEYLKKGGRISSTAAFVGSVLALKPVITLNNGAVELLGTARGSKNGNNFLIKEIEKINGVSGIDFTKPIRLGYTGLTDVLLQKYIKDSEYLWKGNVEQFNICTVGATIGTHIGPNAIAVAYFSRQ